MEFFNDTLDNLLEELIDYRGKTPIKTTSGIPLVTAKIIKNGVINEFNEFIAERDYDRWMVRGFPKQGDVVLTTEAPLGEVAQLDERKIALAQRVVCLRGKSGVLNNTYLKYYFLSNYGKKKLKSRESGTTVTGIKQSELRKVEVCYPSFENQCKIASTLSSLDSKIENNRKICANLEAQAQALFKHWFIDFAPFKDGKFVESELGMIPEGLIYKRIEDMPHTLETGKRPAGGVKGIDNGVPSIGAENIKGLGCYDYSKTKYVTKEYFDSMKKGKIHGYELLVYKDGGKPGYFIPNFAIFGEGYPYKEMCLNEHVFKLDFGNKGYSLFAYFFFKTKQIMSYLNAQGAKAAIPGINSKDIEVIRMPSLDNDCVRNYCDEVEDILTQILVLSKESSRLSSLRDTLLPKLMSGEIKV
ncbi:MAG: restriction endonuclease subunit S [Parabacteroides sp.]|nr:restriction endonuclease subunit S [Parabacteroides sp.]